ncbi:MULTISPECIES: ATP-binding protein [Brenneria]|uniref:histidine kinase n=1 Tax=Brenneria nigrifluens DSM 30175 = ATCC 13028 TaxID=1121120 RepID=A0A2U1UIF6_9GAMM|nr:ATP-binding protein [Brenneria sp. EniD312]PWC21456.1 hypothetical protein DDT54_19170 [Brenneria nigrifluens DSM 30175 = ATCC 13028]QCR06888.1 hypothetical protein EH206_09340 [Brenneria nigrifluens DSM 30175 = ATCC 13028]
MYGSDAETGKRGGCGLGLAIVQAIARAHAGTIAAHGSPLDGARFRFCLPVKVAAPLNYRSGGQSVSPRPISGCHKTWRR